MVVDSVHQLEQFKSEAVFLYPVLKDNRLHNHANQIIAFVVIDLATRKPLTISNGHPEGIFNTNDLSFLKDSKVYCYNTMAFKYAGYDVSNYIDAQMQYYLYTNTGYNQSIPTIITHYSRAYSNCNRINELVSLYKHEEAALEVVNESWVKEIQPGLHFYQNDLLDAFYQIEQNGIGIKQEGFDERFGSTLSRIGNQCFTQYNYYTTTGRPSNRFGGINFAALNKEDDTREFFISKNPNGSLVELDFNSYHPRLIAELINYDFGNDNVYEHLATYYHNTQTPTQEQIESAKEGTFRQLYGGIQQQYLHIPFFSKTNDMAKYLWKEANDKGYVESPISGRRLVIDNYQDINANVLFNYFIQMYETETNVMVLKKIHKMLEGKQTKPVLYTYDSILFDVDNSEIDYLLGEVIGKCIDLDKFPVKIKRGNNYKFLTVC